MQHREGIEAYLFLHLTSFNPTHQPIYARKSLGTHFTGRVMSRDGLEGRGQKSLLPHPAWNPIPSTPQRVAIPTRPSLSSFANILQVILTNKPRQFPYTALTDWTGLYSETARMYSEARTEFYVIFEQTSSSGVLIEWGWTGTMCKTESERLQHAIWTHFATKL
jgi:hypothetical protein